SAVDDGQDLPPGVHDVRLRVCGAGVRVLVDVDEVDAHRVTSSRMWVPLTRAGDAAGVVSPRSWASSCCATAAEMDMRAASWSAVMGRPVVTSWLVTANRAVGIRWAGTGTGVTAAEVRSAGAIGPGSGGSTRASSGIAAAARVVWA